MGKFNLSHYQLTTCDMGQLIPIGLVEVLPGDRIRHSTSLVARLSPLVAPVMHPVTVRIHHFYMPFRRLWDGADTGDSDDFETFITGGTDGNDTSTVPKVTTTATAKNLEDYLGLPRVANRSVSALPIRMYNEIFNFYYRDQDLVSERALTATTLAYIGWEKDYFTTARPWEQKGDAVQLPIGDKAPIVSDYGGGSGTYGNVYTGTQSGGYAPVGLAASPSDSDLQADLAAASGVTVNTLRNALALQRWAETMARMGNRYEEVLRGSGGVNLDGRLDKPEYLGGGSTRLQISEVLQTAPETIVAGQEYGVGDLYGHGIGAARSSPYRRVIPEWGLVMSLMSVRPKAIYTNGIHRSWLRTDREDFHWEHFEDLGQQAVYVDEVYADATNGGNTFGYQDRYMEYREQPSIVTGEFRDTLDYWHLGRDFATEPSLDGTFVTCNPSKRIFQESTNNSLWCFANHRIQAIRRLKQRAKPRTF